MLGVACVAGLVAMPGSLVAWAMVGSGSASDGGNSVSVGASSATSIPAAPGRNPTRGTSSGSTTACRYVPLPGQYAVPLGPGGPTPGAWYLVTCPGRTLTIYNGALIWLASGAPATQASGAVDGTTLAEQAERALTLPAPTIEMNPAGFSVVNLPTWLWVDQGIWHRFSATASAGSVSATAVAMPVSVSWSMGDGHRVVCNGPGTAYVSDESAELQSTNCSYVYTESSAGQPSTDGDSNDGSFVVSATVTWAVSWSLTGASGGGSLTPLDTTTTTRLRVEQIESVDTAG